MKAYIDASVVLRIVFGEPEPLARWTEIEQPVSSELIRVECLRGLERAQRIDRLNDLTVASTRANLLAVLATLQLIPIDGAVLERAAGSFPTLLGTLDAMHLASALAVQAQLAPLTFATHDTELGLAARSVGFAVEGVA
ncbi:MAG: type II toxin-antitoxin system VapC family toxin [Chloroflexota bacterium]